ncbi:hypothetical protein AYK86_01245 [Acinetobacter venetianus]|uniref:hypothetical protein n=1 Tax=Acinetobacter venetianus TaxID=52133 RepID=UPI000775D296|nr:hypothetical protein [Acinetobacter venetianus]KXO87303.1 hypothetical protein AYK86_01245 [Acinetobacter venetianus]
MQKHTLFLVQAPHANLDKIWNELPLMVQANDSIVVMGEALLHIPENILATFSHIYCLSNEQNLLNDSVKDRMSIIEYSQFADLVLQFERSISLK